jgi:hypothetical protein
MESTMKLITLPGAVAGIALIAALTGCSGGAPQEEHVDDGAEGQPDDAIAADDCLIGDWMLDVADYGSQSEAYLVGRGIPITDFAMDGSGLLFFTADGSMQVNVDLVTSGTLVAGDSLVPISVPSHYNASGTWSRPESDVDAINIENVTEDVTAGDETVQVPLLNFADNPRVFIQCDEATDSINLQGADAPLSSWWVRTN